MTRHLDGDPSNNTDANIAIGSHSDNMMDIPQDIRLAKAMKATWDSKHRKFNDNEVVNIREMRALGHTYAEISKIYKVAHSTLSYLFNKAKY